VKSKNPDLYFVLFIDFLPGGTTANKRISKREPVIAGSLFYWFDKKYYIV
jgi:hypothetical protein